MTSAALQWVVLKRTGSEAAVGTMLALSMLPGLVFLPFTGVFIDRHDRRHVAIVLDVVRALAVLSVPAGLLFGEVALPHLYAVSILVGFGFNVYWANASALVQEISGPGEITAASSFFAAAIQGGTLIAGAFVGFTFDHIGLGGVLTIDATTYVISAWCLSRLRQGRHLPQPAAVDRPRNALRAFARDLRAGITFLWRSRGVLRVGAITIFVLAGVYSLQVVTAPLNAKILHSGAEGFGYCNGAWGLGAMIASQAGLVLPGVLPERLSIAGPLIVVAIACAALPYVSTLPVALVCFFCMGYGRGSSGIMLFSRLLKEVPGGLMGRVQTVVAFFGLILRILAMLATGLVARDLSVHAAFGVAVAMWLVASAFAIPRWPAIEAPRTDPGATMTG